MSRPIPRGLGRIRPLSAAEKRNPAISRARRAYRAGRLSGLDLLVEVIAARVR